MIALPDNEKRFSTAIQIYCPKCGSGKKFRDTEFRKSNKFQFQVFFKCQCGHDFSLLIDIIPDGVIYE